MRGKLHRSIQPIPEFKPTEFERGISHTILRLLGICFWTNLVACELCFFDAVEKPHHWRRETDPAVRDGIPFVFEPDEKAREWMRLVGLNSDAADFGLE